jgi:hypothetical protein
MDIVEIFEDTKKRLLEDGEHRPLLIVECKSKNYLLPILHMGDSTFEKEKMLFLMGRALATTQKESAETVRTVYMITEAWMSKQRAGAAFRRTPPPRPSRDPQRIEAILVIMLSTAEKQLHQECYVAEMLRDGSGKLQDLLPYGRMDGVESMMLPAFLAGVASSTWSDKEFARVLRRYGDVGEI